MDITLNTSEQEPYKSDEELKYHSKICNAHYLVIDNSLHGRRIEANFTDDNKITASIANKKDRTGQIFVSVYENGTRTIRIDGEYSECNKHFIVLTIHPNGDILHEGNKIMSDGKELRLSGT